MLIADINERILSIPDTDNWVLQLNIQGRILMTLLIIMQNISALVSDL